MSHWGHRGWGMFPSSKMTTVYSTCRCIKCTRTAVLIITRLGYSSTGKLFAGIPWPGSPCSTSADLPPWPRFSSSISPLPLAHSVSSCSPPMILPPSPTCTPCTSPVPSAALGRRFPLLSPAARTPPPTVSLPPGMGGIPC